MLEQTRQQVASLRQNISKLATERSEVFRAYYDRDFVERRADAHVAAWQDSARYRFEHLGSRYETGGGPSANAISEKMSAVELEALMRPEELKAAMVGAARIGLSDADRNARLRQLDDDILAAEVGEEIALREIDAIVGGHEKRRLDAPPGVLLAPDEELRAAAQPAKSDRLLKKAG